MLQDGRTGLQNGCKTAFLTDMDINTPTPRDFSSIWDDIRPYRDDEIPSAMQRIASNKDFPQVMEYIYGPGLVEKKMEEFTSYKTVSQFQINFMFDAINAIIEK